MNHVRFAQFLALFAGLLDFGVGLGLAFLPAKFLPLMGTPTPSDEALVYLRFVGAFVAAVGASYLWALIRSDITRLCSVLEFTILFRLAAGIFSSIAIVRGWLATAWAPVPATDFILIGVQLWLILKLPKPDVSSSSPSSL